MTPAAAALRALLAAAAVDGHTVIATAVAGSVLRGRNLRLEDALRELGPSGSAVVVAPAPDVLALRSLADAERAIASHVRVLADTDRLRLVVAPPGTARDSVVAEVTQSGGPVAVADDAQYLDVETLATFLGSCAADELVVLAGDLADLGSPGAGRAFGDIVAANVAPVVRAASLAASRAGETADAGVLAAFRDGLSRGELPTADDPTRRLVIVPASTADEVRQRVEQLVGASIPRAFGFTGADVQVLSPLRSGAAGAIALGGRTVHDALGRTWPAVVLALPPECSGTLSRALVYSAASCAADHLSIVQAAGAAFATAIRSVPAPARRTLLPGLLAGRAPGEPAPPDHSSDGSQSRPATSSASSSLSSSSVSSSSSSSGPSTGPNGVTSSYAENSASSYASLADARAS